MYRILCKGKVSGETRVLQTSISNEEDADDLVEEFNEQHGELMTFWKQDESEPLPEGVKEITIASEPDHANLETVYLDPLLEEEE
ncbi:MAG: hypothetical protein JSV16_09030 [Candidatus Hydrogenedentota bacterium]|nr:MAG: hypothetical protein JSV16_09030 [Candidatus Hydrogenedentota bacterium]